MQQGTDYRALINVGEPICDFCSSGPVTRRFHCKPFVMHESVVGGKQCVDHSPDDWASCAVCAALIDAGDREGLAERSVRLMAEKHPELLMDLRLYAGVMQEIRELHAKCFDNMTGSRSIADGQSRRGPRCHLPPGPRGFDSG